MLRCCTEKIADRGHVVSDGRLGQHSPPGDADADETTGGIVMPLELLATETRRHLAIVRGVNGEGSVVWTDPDGNEHRLNTGVHLRRGGLLSADGYLVDFLPIRENNNVGQKEKDRVSIRGIHVQTGTGIQEDQGKLAQETAEIR